MKEFGSIFHEEVILLDEGVVSNLIKSIFGKSGTPSKIKKSEVKTGNNQERNFNSLPDEVKKSIEELYNEEYMKELSKYTLTKSKLSDNDYYYYAALIISMNNLRMTEGHKRKTKCKSYYTFYKDTCYVVIDIGDNKYIYYLTLINPDTNPDSSVLLFLNK